MQVKEGTVWTKASSKGLVCKVRQVLHLGFRKGNADNNLYLRTSEDGILIIEVFVDDIIFGDNNEMCKKFSKELENEFEMSMIGEMKFFLGLQINQSKNEIFIS